MPSGPVVDTPSPLCYRSRLFFREPASLDPTDYKSTIRLPKTDFPMKADLAKREPLMLAQWAEPRYAGKPLDDAILDARKGSPTWVFHDGPPYANGHIHYGHILNKTLKDIVVKSRSMMGLRVEFKPGWDTHGLPIELAVLRELGDQAATLSPVEIRKACHAYAMKWVGIQRDEFRRLGVFGTWANPYLTLDHSYEATIIRQLAEFARKGLLYRDRKPVHWCMSCKTALAEAEIEYDDAHVSPSIYVRFSVEPGLAAVIWTTTPWTLPANHAIAYNPTFDYVTVAARHDGNIVRYIVAEKLADAVVKAAGLVEEGPREPFPVDNFKRHVRALHPFIDRPSIFVPADYVTLEQGTGLVHTAPGHGADDYITGKKHGLPVEAPVEDNGTFSDGIWKGEHVFRANPKIVEYLATHGALLSSPSLKLTHSYPICWRCKNPVIFRATWQWFAAMDGRTDQVPDATVNLRAEALREIGRTQWIPPWGENRIRGMIENRPDWVLSRQRVWGVPIPVFYADSGSGAAPILDAELMTHIAGIVEKEGVDAWFGREPKDLLPPGAQFDALRALPLVKGNDIVDVWFESGVSWAAVCEGKPGLDNGRPDDPRPVDLYLEGSDQHRGWFHSSLLASAATRGRAPYRAVLTHGFVLDERGRPYSKSEIEKARREGIKIEFIPPEEVLKTQGAELLRLWTAAADFRTDIAYSRGHLAQLGESYRKIRNTARFLLGNLVGFDPATDYQPGALVDLLDRYVHGRVNAALATARAAYESYEFHVVVRAMLDLCTTDLSALYLDVRKDRLYCDAETLRKQTQTVLYAALRVLATTLAPVLCFTAEEIWSYLPKLPGDPESVHLATFPPSAGADRATAGEVDASMEEVLALRAAVHAALEPFRAQKKASLEAHVILPASAATLPARRGGDADWLADLFIVSRVSFGSDETIRVEDAGGHKCARCWKYTPDTPICARCRAVVGE